MTRARPRPLAPALALAATAVAVLLAGCGGPSDERKQTDRARYARASNAICRETTRTFMRIVRWDAPTYLGLNSYAIAARQRLEIGAAKLHRLRTGLGDSTSEQIDSFDRALDPFVTSLSALDAVDEGEATTSAAARIRRRGNTLFRAAQAAKLKRCGRGGNAVADHAELVVYAVAFKRVDEAALKRLAPLLRRFDRAPAGSDTRAIASRRITRVFQIAYRAIGRLDPPRDIRRLHQAVRRRLREVLDIREQVRAVTPERFEQLRARLNVRADRFYRAERRLVRALNR